MNERLNGSWVIEQVLANDIWGGPLCWRDVSPNKKVVFANGKYYENTSGSLEQIGSYKIESNNTLIVTSVHADPADILTFHLTFEFDAEGRLTLHKNQHEGIVAEKFKHEWLSQY